MVLARETDLGKKQGGDLEDRSTKKQRILVESVHIFRLISSISIVFDEKQGNSCLNGILDSYRQLIPTTPALPSVEHPLAGGGMSSTSTADSCMTSANRY